jgi:hypothetical protein
MISRDVDSIGHRMLLPRGGTFIFSEMLLFRERKDEDEFRKECMYE